MANMDFYNKVNQTANLADGLSEAKLLRIAQMVSSGYQTDKSSRADWESLADRSLELAKMKFEEKTTPWKGASNVKYPIIARAAIQFAANATGEIVNKDRAVETVVLGKDPDGSKAAKADRISDFMNYQLLVKNTKWMDSMDRTIQLMAVVGTVFRKVYFDPVTGDNCSELCLHNEIIVNNNITSLGNARRITHIMKMHSNNIVENIRAGTFSEIDDDLLHIDSDDDGSKIHTVLEQHCFIDLDEDGYEEPYIVTVLEDEQKILRIYPRYRFEDVVFNEKEEVRYIKPCQYFIDYHCIPSCDGSYYSIGFGALLHTLNETINTGINQLIDAGTLANTQTGFMSKGLNMKSGAFKMTPGTMHKVEAQIDGDIGRNIFMMQFKEPSAVLFQLMGLLDQVAKELSTTTDIMTGNQLAQNAPATSVMSLIERGMKVYSSIQKRLFRALTNEYRLWYELNRKYLDPAEYANVLDDPDAILARDFEERTIDVKTIADPEIASDAMRLAQVQFLLQFANAPGINTAEIYKRAFAAAKIKNIEEIVPDHTANPADQAQMQQQQITQMQLQLQERQQQVEEYKVQLDAQKLEIDKAVKIKKLEQVDEKHQLQVQKVMVDNNQHDKELQVEMAINNQNAAVDLAKAHLTSQAKVNADNRTD